MKIKELKKEISYHEIKTANYLGVFIRTDEDEDWYKYEKADAHLCLLRNQLLMKLQRKGCFGIGRPLPTNGCVRKHLRESGLL